MTAAALCHEKTSMKRRGRISFFQMLGLDPQNSDNFVLAAFPAWARLKAMSNQQLDDAAFYAGAGLSSLEQIVRRSPAWIGVWRQRLALTAAAASMRMIGRSEGETDLRDAWLLRRPGDDAGPAGRVLLLWRRLAQRSTDLSRDGILGAGEALGLVLAERAAEIEAVASAILLSERTAIDAAAKLCTAVVELVPRGELLALWLAEIVLAQKLRWPIPVPLLAGQLGHRFLRSGEGGRRPRPTDEGWHRSVCLAYALGSAHANDLAHELSRRAQKLEDAVPKLRAKGAPSVTTALLEDDAIAPSARLSGISDRGMRRLFDRLVSLGVVRELSGRETFRLYGL
jgi:hypothetical protein